MQLWAMESIVRKAWGRVVHGWHGGKVWYLATSGSARGRTENGVISWAEELWWTCLRDEQPFLRGISRALTDARGWGRQNKRGRS